MDIMSKLAEIGGSLDTARSVMFGMHGGPQKFDCWLTNTAEMMAKSTVNRMQFSSMPFGEKLGKPHEVVDMVLDNLASVDLWFYEVEIQNGVIRVIDPISEHVIEEHPFTQEMFQILESKYGQNNGISGSV